jgi:mannose-6-phosphate isomerase-like protein (cupin superfamily)
VQKIDPYASRLDERGGFLGITREGWAEINFIETAAEQTRGNHYHKETRELFFIISGEIEITIDNILSGEHSEMRVSKGDVFVIEPYEVHTFFTKTKAQWINMLSKPIDEENPDFHRVPDKQ